MTTAYISLGSNLNDPIVQIKTALESIANIPETLIQSTSSFYQTAPVGFLDQPDFINAVCAVNTNLSAQQLFEHLQSIEKKQGRIRDGQRNRPRTLDLDLLLFGDQTIQEDNLIIPHPRMFERDFVLIPLAEIAPDATILPVIPRHCE